MKRAYVYLIPFLSLVLLANLIWAAETPNSRVLVIGIDGLRRDALIAAKTPNLDTLIGNGVLVDTTRILGWRDCKNDTISGPGWSSFLTGVWADKHGVLGNQFINKNLEAYPHFFVRVREQFPDARMGSFVDWLPIDKHLVREADVRTAYDSHNSEQYQEHDVRITSDVKKFLSDGDPHVAMVYLGAVDETGHQHGFHPSVQPYLQAIQQIDVHVGEILTAMKSRTDFESENWLVIVSTDHGGQGTGHSSGHQDPQIVNTFLIVSGEAARKQPINRPTYIVDIPVTAMTHLGVDIDASWKLDGKAVAIER